MTSTITNTPVSRSQRIQELRQRRTSSTAYSTLVESTDTPPKVAILCRVSTTKQANEGTIEVQLAQCKELLAKHFGTSGDRVLVTTSLNEGYNLESKDERFSFWHVMRQITAGEVNALIVPNMSRLIRGRNLQLNAEIRTILNKHRVRIITSEGVRQHNPTDVSSDLVDNVTDTIGIIDKKMMVTRLQNARRFSLQRHRKFRVGIPPLGYRCLVTGSGRNKEYEYKLVESEAAIVRDIFALYVGAPTKSMPQASKPLGIAALAKHLMLHGVSRKSWLAEIPEKHQSNQIGDRWTGVGISMILKNPIYMGKLVIRFKETNRDSPYYGEEILEALDVPAAVTEELWAQAEKLRTSKYSKLVAQAKDSPGYEANFLNGMIICSQCGCRLTAVKPKRNYEVQTRYRCTSDSTKHNHENRHRSFIAEEVDTVVAKALTTYLLEGTLEEKLYPQIPTSMRKYHEQLQVNIARVDKQLETLLDLHLEGEIDRATYQEKKRSVTTKRRELIEKLESQTTLEAPAETRATLKMLRQQLTKASPSKIYRILRLTTEHLIQSIRIIGMSELDIKQMSEKELHEHYRSGRLARRDLETRFTPSIAARKFGFNHRVSRLDYNIAITWNTGTEETLPVLDWTGWKSFS